MPPTLLIILDGWGHRRASQDNAIALAHTPHYDTLLRDYPHGLLDASGRAVGLPPGIMGNSEVGHLTLGGGRIAQVGLTRIYAAIADGSFFRNPALLQACAAVRETGHSLHLIGLVSDGAVHSHQDHLFALLRLAKEQGISKLAIHAITDGRDTDPQHGLDCLKLLQEKIAEIGLGQIATVSGRYYAMDRDQRWERTEKAYRAMVEGEGERTPDVLASLSAAYARGEGDEFLLPQVCTDAQGQPSARIEDGDAAIFFNFRADRARQLTQALTEREFSAFPRPHFPSLKSFVCMSNYDAKFRLPVAFPPEYLHDTLGEVVARAGKTQLRLAETEKYAHVTFFFSGGVETSFPGEERLLVPSPREVATYDLKPQMSAPAITEKLIAALREERFDLIVVNFANADMVGHSGKLAAAIQAVAAIDEQLGKIIPEVLAHQGTLLLTADHGNCERMRDEKKRPHTAHTLELVPYLLIGERFRGASSRPLGTLADVAPTLLQIMGLPKPPAMLGSSLLAAS